VQGVPLLELSLADFAADPPPRNSRGRPASTFGAMPSCRGNSVNLVCPRKMASRMISRLHRSPLISSTRVAEQFR
jgi:hypothetical protein